MPDTGTAFNWRLPLGNDIFKVGFQAVRDMATDIAATITGINTRLTTAEDKLAHPIAQMRTVANQTGIALGWQPILMDVVDYQTVVGFAANRTGGSRDSRWTCPAGEGGTYAVEGACTWSGTAVGANFNASIRKNGVAQPNSWSNNDYVVAAGNVVGVSTGRHLITLAPGDYVELYGYYSVASWSTFWTTDAGPYFVVERVR
jgi:hypothetical protein